MDILDTLIDCGSFLSLREKAMIQGTQKPRFSYQVESGVLYFRATYKAARKTVVFQVWESRNKSKELTA